jgi:hypothetical protein
MSGAAAGFNHPTAAGFNHPLLEFLAMRDRIRPNCPV